MTADNSNNNIGNEKRYKQQNANGMKITILYRMKCYREYIIVIVREKETLRIELLVIEENEIN